MKGSVGMTAKSESFEIFMYKTIAKTLLDKGIITLERYTAIVERIENNRPQAK